MVKFVSADGRAFTSFQPNCELNRGLKEAYNIQNNYTYRLFLQRNASKLMQQDRSYAYRKNKLTCACPSCVSLSKL